jgi:hypothetical protein
MYYKIEHVLHAESVGADLAARWVSDDFAALRTHGYDVVHTHGAIGLGATMLIRVDWPEHTSRHIHLELMPSWPPDAR